MEIMKETIKSLTMSFRMHKAGLKRVCHNFLEIHQPFTLVPAKIQITAFNQDTPSDRFPKLLKNNRMSRIMEFRKNLREIKKLLEVAGVEVEETKRRETTKIR